MLRDLGHPAADGAPQYDITYENVQAGERTVRIVQGLVGWHAPQLVLQLRTALAETLAIAGQLIETPLRLCALLLQLGQPCTPRHLAGAATDEPRCRLAPGAARTD